MPFSSSSPLRTAISKVESALLASPLANEAIALSASSLMSTLRVPKPRSSVIARERRAIMSSSESACKTKTLQRERSAPLTSKEGFSVVAPMRIMLPFSTKGRKASC